MDEINQVMAMVDSAVGTASSYHESLADMSNKLGSAKDREGIRAIIESLESAIASFIVSIVSRRMAR